MRVASLDELLEGRARLALDAIQGGGKLGLITLILHPAPGWTGLQL